MKTSIAFLTLLLSGCATCQQHPTACAVGTALVAGAIAASIVNSGSSGYNGQPAHPTCTNTGCIGNPSIH